MDSSELPAGPIDVDSDALTAIDPNPPDHTRPHDIVGVLNEHYTAWRDALRASRQQYDEHLRLAREGDDPVTRGEHGSYALRKRQRWSRALGALDALEALADELQVELDEDRRPYLRPEDHK